MTTTTIIGEIILIFIGLVMFGILTLLLKSVIRKIYKGLKTKETLSTRETRIISGYNEPYNGTQNIPEINMNRNGVIQKYEYFEKTKSRGDGLTGTEIGTENQNIAGMTSVIIKKPERVEELTSNNDENDFTRPYYSGRGKKE